MAVLHGHVVVDGPVPKEPLVAAVVWLTYDRYVGGFLAVSSPLEGEFPSNFTVDVVQPPPPEAFGHANVEGDERFDFVQGVIAAIPADHVGKELAEEDIAGIAMDYGLVYFKPDADFSESAPSGAMAHSYNLSPSPGYHLFHIEREVDQEYLECLYAGLCVDRVPSSLDSEFDFKRCLATIEEPILCTQYSEPTTEEQLAADSECSQLWREMRTGECEFPWSWPKNDDGLDASIMISMGKGFQHWKND